MLTRLGLIECCLDCDAEGEDEGFVELHALDAEFVEEAGLLGGGCVDGCGVFDQEIEDDEGFAQGGCAGFGVGGIECVLCVGDAFVDDAKAGAQRGGRVGDEGGDAFDAGVDAGEDAGVDAVGVAIGLRSAVGAEDVGAVAVVGDVVRAGAGEAGVVADLGFLQGEAFAGELDVA